MAFEPLLDLSSLETYQQSCLAIAESKLAEYGSMAEIEAAEDDINAYPRIDGLEDPKDLKILSERTVDQSDRHKAKEAVLDGRVFWEHTAAGEATRLKMGTKYLIDPVRDVTVDVMARRLSEERGGDVSPAEIEEMLDARPQDLLPLNLGERHLLQHAFDLSRLAEEHGRDPDEVLSSQKMLVILNEKTASEIVDRLRSARFLGFSRQNCFFMIQPAFPGIVLENGRFAFDSGGPTRLHNHGQLVMQETMDGQIFHLDEAGGRVYINSLDTEAMLERSLVKISYNIEDLDYLTGAVEFMSLAQAIRLGAEGYNMVMEVVANDPERPIKGGMAAFDPELDQNVMIESFQLKGLPNRDIKYLNKNFNHYTNPAVSYRELKKNGLPMPIVVKNDRLYFQPVQGDINFLVRTAFVQRERLKPIRAWKSASNTPEAINAMAAQDRQPGFREFAARATGYAL